MQENVKISKMDKKETNLKKKNNKFLLKNCMTNNFIWKYIYVSLCTYFYVDPTISSKAKIRKTISMLRLTQKNTVLIEKRVKHFLLNEHIKIFWYERTLTNKYCKTGIRERTLLKSRFVKPCMHVPCLMRTVLLMLHVQLNCKY